MLMLMPAPDGLSIVPNRREAQRGKWRIGLTARTKNRTDSLALKTHAAIQWPQCRKLMVEYAHSDC
jgi:hypothetical protein